MAAVLASLGRCFCLSCAWYGFGLGRCFRFGSAWYSFGLRDDLGDGGTLLCAGKGLGILLGGVSCRVGMGSGRLGMGFSMM